MPLRTPPLRDAHETDGATFTDFGGWEMPVDFGSIRTEHESVRERVGKFDVSHMGELTVAGPDAERLTNRLTTNDVSDLAVGEGHYTALTDADGALIDDTTVYRRDDDEYLIVPNAGHDETYYERWTDYRDEWDLAASVENVTAEYALYAIQGPDAEDLVAAAAGEGVRELSFFEIAPATVRGVDCDVARSGYTGEDGFELLCPAEDAETVWEAFDCQPCGLGARDTLRTEMGYLLSGQDFHPEENPRTPYEAGIGFVVDLDAEFVGRDSLAAQATEGIAEEFVGFRMIDRGVPRHGYDVRDVDGNVVGTVTSGTMSPTLGEPIGLGYVPSAYEPGDAVDVVVRGDPKRAEIASPPFLEGYQ